MACKTTRTGRASAIHAINKNDQLAANQFAVLAAIDDDDGVDEDEMDEIDAECGNDKDKVEEDKIDEIVAQIEEEEGEVIDEVREDEQRPPPPGTQYVNGQIQFIDGKYPEHLKLTFSDYYTIYKDA